MTGHDRQPPISRAWVFIVSRPIHRPQLHTGQTLPRPLPSPLPIHIPPPTPPPQPIPPPSTTKPPVPFPVQPSHSLFNRSPSLFNHSLPCSTVPFPVEPSPSLFNRPLPCSTVPFPAQPSPSLFNRPPSLFNRARRPHGGYASGMQAALASRVGSLSDGSGGAVTATQVRGSFGGGA
eukprot:scaffold8042_cov64-Isochrysis_galbana.AAC.1